MKNSQVHFRTLGRCAEVDDATPTDAKVTQNSADFEHAQLHICLIGAQALLLLRLGHACQMLNEQANLWISCMPFRCCSQGLAAQRFGEMPQCQLLCFVFARTHFVLRRTRTKRTEGGGVPALFQHVPHSRTISRTQRRSCSYPSRCIPSANLGNGTNNSSL